MDELNLEFERLFAVSGWNQARVAKELQLHASVISRYRKGRAKPSLTVLSFFATKLGERLLLPGVDPGTPISDGPAYLDSCEQELVTQIRRFHPAQRREIVRGLSIVLDAVAHPVTYASPEAKAALDKMADPPTNLSDETIAAVENDLRRALAAQKRRRKGKT